MNDPIQRKNRLSAQSVGEALVDETYFCGTGKRCIRQQHRPPALELGDDARAPPELLMVMFVTRL
jgi:hypothetical protein